MYMLMVVITSISFRNFIKILAHAKGNGVTVGPIYSNKSHP